MADPDQAGESAVTAIFGVAVFLAFLLLAAQTLTHLYASSVVSAAALDAATFAAARSTGDPAGGAARAAGESRAAALLGRLDDRPPESGSRYVWQVSTRAGGSREVALTVRVASPSDAIGALGLGDIERTVRVTVEEDPA